MSDSVDGYQQKHVSFSTVEAKDLPFHCPPKGAQTWNMHPKVFLQFGEDGKASCPYCSASYELA